MNVSRAKLYGVINPTGQVDGFCIPIFTARENSNHFLVQVVSERNYIEGFEPFHCSDDIEKNIQKVDADITKEIGDPAFWYFGLGENPLFGTIDDIRSHFTQIKYNLEDKPYVYLQIVTACHLEQQEVPAVRAVHESLLENVGDVSANAWLDTSVISPKVRRWLGESSSQTKRGADFRRLTSGVLAVTNNNTTFVFVPEDMKGLISAASWRRTAEQLEAFLRHFGLKFAEFSFVYREASKATAQSNVSSLKRDAVAVFAKERSTILRQLTRSYFEDPSGALRVVCTFSSRYEGKGKRKYWFGYHEIWNQWLEGAKDGFILLGCADKRICFALPLPFIRAHLSNLRYTGSGKDKYWHLDIVDLPGKTNLLDIPRLHQGIDLSKFLFRF
ncbi:hypothetical protein [Bradyrhizobium sp. SYSU BS000235]|uniref:hypothetical protein n=1 Tax=Bradyrhizobium sp. SYSU BS000235 TaxID=3411332 RepID=UPI003C71986D